MVYHRGGRKVILLVEILAGLVTTIILMGTTLGIMEWLDDHDS